MRLLMVLPIVLLVAGCGGSDKSERERAERDGGVTIDLDSDKQEGKAAVAGNVLEVDSADGKGRVALNLPGGIGAQITLPTEIMKDAKMEIGGVGLYPGARVRSLNVNGGGDEERGVVTFAFAAPAAPATVADWYERQFAEKKITAARAGETLTGKTDDGDDFTLTLAATDTGSTGTMRIVDRKKGS
ncbi:hypothetical protein IP88_15055 [alpha proteobacterium AAP81b]|nr:hypothetical protein IP88_15055 [alpha proteobacterium AAP81b]